MSIGTTVIELCEFNEKKKNVDKLTKISCCNFGKRTYSSECQLCFDMYCTVKSLSQIDLKLKARSQFSNVWGEY